MDPVTDRRKSVTEILSANRKFAGSTARALEDLLAPVLHADKPMPDLVYLQQLFADALDRGWRRLWQADETCHGAQAYHHAMITARDDEARELYREVVDLRIILRGRFSSAPSKNFIGLRGDTSRDPVVLLRQADRAVARLRDRARATPPPKVAPSATSHMRAPGATIASRRCWATPLAEAADVLRGTIDRVAAFAKQLEAARLERKRALESFNDTFVLIAGLFEALYLVTGRPDRAKWVRPSKHRPGWLHKEDKERGRRQSGTRPASARLLSFKTLRRVWRRFPARRQSG